MLLGADLKSLDIDNRRPVDIACGLSRRFLRKMKKNKNDERRHFKKIFSFLFGRKDSEQDVIGAEITPTSNLRRSCPPVIAFNAFQPPEPMIRNSPIIEEVLGKVSVSKDSTVVPEERNVSTTSYETARNERISDENLLNDAFLTMDNTTASGYLDCINSVTEDQQMNEMSREEIDLREQLSNLSIECLKLKLKEKSCEVGPMNAKNRKLYEAKLARLELNLNKQEDRSLNRYSDPLRRMIMDERMSTEKTRKMGEFEEHIIRNEYLQSTYRNDVSFFCYLLIDPTKINTSLCSFEVFISAIFYVGKGKHYRPLQHFIDAHRCRPLMRVKTYEPTDKLKRILDLWDSGSGVISLPILHNIHSAEALVREGCMMEAIGLDNLTNIRKGNFGGLPFIWTKRQQEELGANLLRKAHIIFKNERCRPVFEADIA